MCFAPFQCVEISMGIQKPPEEERDLIHPAPVFTRLAHALLNATSSGNLKVAQNMRFFGATSLTS